MFAFNVNLYELCQNPHFYFELVMLPPYLSPKQSITATYLCI